jgi:hypothetical protein
MSGVASDMESDILNHIPSQGLPQVKMCKSTSQKANGSVCLTDKKGKPVQHFLMDELNITTSNSHGKGQSDRFKLDN